MSKTDKVRKFLKSIPLILGMAILTLGCGEDRELSGSTSDEALFVDVTDNEAQALALTADESSPSLRKRFARVQFGVLRKEAERVEIGESKRVYVKIRLNLFQDEAVEVLLDQVEKVADDNIIFTGQVAGDLESAVTLVMNQGVLVANIRKSDSSHSYEVRFAKNGIHTISLVKDDEAEGCVAIEAQPAEGEESASRNDFSLASPVVDILGAYTPNARIKMGGTSGIVALIQLGVADTNRALYDSGVSLQVRLVGTLELKRNESGNWSSDLSYLRGKTDGRWDEVHAKRSAVGADQVSVVATYPYQSGTNGIGYVNSTYSSAFTIVRYSAFKAYTFSHELGHNLGLNHSDGYVNTSGKFRTIIAYGSYPRIRRYSNPYIPYNGYRTGDSSRYEAKIINARAPYLASVAVTKIF